MKRRRISTALLLGMAAIGAAIALASSPSIVWSGPQEGATRQVFPEEFVKARPATGAASARRLHYVRVGPAAKLGAAAAKSSEARQLGITIWRLRPSLATDSGPRVLVQEGSESVEWTPERVTAEAPLRVGDRVRLAVESPQKGYLYVADREQYADGTLGDAYLIFPTTRTRRGVNQVTAGQLIEIPGQEDHPDYFTVRQSRPDQIGEQLTIVVMEKPLEGISPGPKAVVLSRDRVATWEKDSSGQVEQFELVGGKGRAWTKAEQQAGADGTRLLTQDDPGPQTIYRVVSPPDAPLLVKLKLRYRKPGTTRPPASALSPSGHHQD